MDDLREHDDVLHLAAAQKWLPKLVSALRAERKKRSATLAQIGDMFGDPLRLAKFYVQPLCQQNNPATEDRDIDAVVCSDAFATLATFFERCKVDLASDGRRQMFILADAGMGKTSLLIMLRLAHLFSFWPSARKCVLLKLGTNTFEEISKLADHAHTILLLDSLDEDPSAIGRIRDRLSDILAQTSRFYAVVITCRTQYFPVTDPDPLERLGSVRVVGYRCPIIYLSPFTDHQVNEYLRKRFPRNFWRWLSGRDSLRHIRAKKVLEKTLTLHLRPMLLAYIDDLVGIDTDRELSAFEAFDLLVREWLEREVRRGKIESKEALYAACSAVARCLDKLGQRAISRDQLTEVYLEDPKVQNIELIDVGGRALLNMTSAGAFRFAHFALQEFVLVKEIIQRTLAHSAREEAGNIELFSVRGTTELISFVYGGLTHQRPNLLRLIRYFAQGKYLQNPGKLPFFMASLEQLIANFSSSIRAISHVEFRDAHFSSAQLNSIGFVACGLRGSSFARAQLNASMFVGCDMQNANIANASLVNSVFANVDLRGADLSGSNLCGANLRASDLQSTGDGQTLFKGAVYDEQTKWPIDFDYDAAGAVVHQVELREIFRVRTDGARVTGDTEITTDRGAVRRLVW